MFWRTFWRNKGPYIRPTAGGLIFFDEKRFLKSITQIKAQQAQNGDPAKPDKNALIQVFKDALYAVDKHFGIRFKEGEDIHKLVNDRAHFIDRLIFHAWELHSWDDDIALYAVGGYGRAEMHPHSDIDLLFLLKHNLPKRYQDAIQQFLTFLWDIQLKIGHSVRTPRQCAQMAKSDATVMTNLLERRMLIGDMALETLLQKQLAKIWPADAFFEVKLAEQQKRHSKHGITEFDLEPNVKESPGGLRDIQTIHWVAKRTYDVYGLEKLAGKGFYTEEEYNSLHNAESFLWRVRFGLHLLSSRPTEQLDFESQRELATMLGYVDTPKRRAVEQFMQHYYQTASIIREITDVLMQVLSDELLPDRGQKTEAINDRFQLRGRILETRHDQVFAEEPSAILEAFLLLAKHEYIESLGAETIRQLRTHGHLINDDFRASPKNRQLFLDILKCTAHLSLPLQRMSRYAVLGRYLPEFGDITGITQHDLFHIYPVDIHTMAVVDNMLSFGKPESRSQFPVSSYTYSSYNKPEILVIAALYHDIGKGKGGDHSEIGAELVERFARNHGMSPREIRLLSWLVKNHLFMSRVAQREDITDPDVIARFARHVGDETHLNLLYALTSADILATNPTLWNNWRASLMRQLFHSTRKMLRSGQIEAQDQADIISETQVAAAKKLANQSIEQQQYQHYWDQLDDLYFIRESAEDIAWHTQTLLQAESNAPEPMIATRPFIHFQRERATVFFICVKNSATLFCQAAIAVGNAGLNIQDARLYDTQGWTLLSLYILDANAESLSSDESRINRLRTTLLKDLASDNDALISPGRTPRRLKQFPVPTRTKLEVLNGQCTLEVVTADRPGLLAEIAQIFVEHEVVIRSAKITTLGERVEDLFVVETLDGQPLLSEGELSNDKAEALQKAICTRIDERVESSAA